MKTEGQDIIEYEYNLDTESLMKIEKGGYKKIKNLSDDLSKFGESLFKNLISPIEVYNKYKSKYLNTIVKEVELEAKYGSYIYEIEGFDEKNKYELKIHPINGEILKEKIKVEKTYKGEITKEHMDRVANLIETSLEDVGKDEYLYKWKAEYDSGIPELEIEINKGEGKYKYKYNLDNSVLIGKK